MHKFVEFNERVQVTVGYKRRLFVPTQKVSHAFVM